MALVTGARRGIGAAVVRRLSDDGLSVVAVVRSIVEVPGATLVLAGDVTRDQDVSCLVLAARRDVGPIDILVNNVGGFLHPTRTADTTLEQWNEQIALNLTSAFLMCREVLPGMMERGWGRIVNVGSVVAHAPALGNAAAYVAAKAGLAGLTRQIALEAAGTGVTANVVNPGSTATEHLDDYFRASGSDPLEVASTIPLRRFATPDEIAAAVRYLVADDAGFTTGATVNVNGGVAFT